MIFLRREQLFLELTMYEQYFGEEQSKRIAQLDNHKNKIPAGMDETDIEIYELQLEKMEIDFEMFMKNSEKRLAEIQKQFEETVELLSGERIYAPFDGMVRYITNKNFSADVFNGEHLVTLYDTSVYQVIVERANTDLMRFGDIVEILYGDEFVFNAKVVSDPLVNFRSPPLDSGVFILQPLNFTEDVSYFDDPTRRLTAQYKIVDLDDVVLVPKQAIRTEDQNRYVYIYENGVQKKRYVQTGLEYQGEVQILSGLEIGQEVIIS